MYRQLDDPALAGETKPKYIVVINTSPLDDPIVYVLTTSEKEKHSRIPGLFRVPAGSYEFWAKETLLDVSTAGDLDIDNPSFCALYEAGDIECEGHLSPQHVSELVESIRTCPSVSRRFKQTLG